MDKGDIVKISRNDGSYKFGVLQQWLGGQEDGLSWIVVGIDGESYTVFGHGIKLATTQELFEAYRNACQQLNETETAYQTLRQEHIDIVNDAQAHLRGPF